MEDMDNLKAICNVSKLGFWEWKTQENNFLMKGYFGSLEGTLGDFLKIVHPLDRNNLEKTILQFVETKWLFEKTFRIQLSPGLTKWVFMRGHYQTLADNKIHGIIVDVTHWKKMQDNNHLQQLALMEQRQHNSRDEVVSLLAHELTQPLMVINTYISGCIYRLQENKIDNTQLIDIMNIIKHHSSQIGNRIHELKSALKESHLEYRNTNIHEVINESTLLLTDELEMQGITIDFNFQEDLPEVNVNRNQIKHVLYNLIKNSIDNISTGFNNVSIKTNRMDGSSIAVTIADNNQISHDLFGDKDLLTMINNKDKELQMEFAMCRTIIESHGGTLSYLPSPEGSYFQFTLRS